jgi:DNA-binding LacI/PurR family transcriptional regulator
VPETGSHPPTLETVAAVAGVSRATVSRVINNSPRVSPAVRAAVEQAIDTLGYRPNRAARTLVTRRTDSIALIIPEPDTRFFADPFFAVMVRAIGRELAATDKQLMVLLQQVAPRQPGSGGGGAAQAAHATHAVHDVTDRLERYVTGGHVDGVLMLSVHDGNPLPGALARAGVPIVLGGRVVPLPAGVTYVDVDNVALGRTATEHLLAIGRRRVATIAGTADMVVSQHRLAGYRTAVAAAGLPQLVAYGDFTESGGAVAMRELLAGPDRPDAVFIASDLMATGALGVLRAAGLRIPADVAIVGCDDLGVAAHTDPPLTTIHQPVGLMAHRMIGMLLDRIDGAPVPAPVVLDATLVPRSSG